MSRRVAKACLGRDAGQDFLAIGEMAHPVLNRLQPPRGPSGKGGPGGTDCVNGCRIAPIIPFNLTHVIAGIGEDQIVKIIQHAPEVIRVAVGKNYICHRLRRYANCLKTIQQHPGRGHEGGT